MYDARGKEKLNATLHSNCKRGLHTTFNIYRHKLRKRKN